ncbi:MAG: MBL fold metallo-hydrolase [Oscillibacter sp.]|nr:MBL fold metallo-hydrolase [Oscillibacter sp.]
MDIQVFVNNPWEENTIVLYDDTKEAAVIDCGCFLEEERVALQSFLTEKGLKPVVLLNTHLHPDHIFGNEFMKKTYALETQAGEEDNFLIQHAVEYAAMLGISGIAQPPEVGKFLKDGDVVRFGKSELEVIAVPGHSPGGLCFYSRKDKLLIAGDVLFAGSVGRSDLPGGNGVQLLEAIRTRLFVLDGDVKVIPGHGPATMIEKEKKYNPFFQ